MARNATPLTAAERQRAHRERKRAQLDVDPGPQPDDPDSPDEQPPIGDPPGPDEAAAIDHVLHLAEMLHQAVKDAGGQRFVSGYMRKTPGGGLKLYRDMAIALKRDSAPPGVEIYVQQLVLTGAQPVPGVLASPITAHIAPQRTLLPAPGEVVDAA